MKIVFFGTPAFAAYSLEKIAHSTHEILAVVTAPDKPKGRGRAIQKSEVKLTAEKLNIPVYQPTNLKNEDFLQQMESLHADIFVVIAFRMMPKVLFSMPMMGTFNLHASLLPDYRGAAPINYAIINGEEKTGVTTFFINEKIDEGEILIQKSIDIHPADDAGSLHDRLMIFGSEVVLETLDALAAGTIAPTSQPNFSDKKAFKINKEDLIINWNLPAITVQNFIRGMSPYPAAFSRVKVNGQEKILKIYAAEVVPNQKLASGEVKIFDNQIFVGCAEGVLSLTEIQPEGKKRMTVRDFLNGQHTLPVIEIISF